MMLLNEIAHGRSGDKGNHANIAIIAYTSVGFTWLKENLSADRVKDYFQSMKPTRVVRYEAPKVLGLNFVVYDILAGGASRSLRIDTQGKTLALALLQIATDRPDNYREMLRQGTSRDSQGASPALPDGRGS